MTSIAQFEVFLRGEAKRTMSEVEINFKRLSFEKPELLDDVKVAVSHRLNTLYYEIQEFIAWLEDEVAEIRSKSGKVLLDDLENTNAKIRDFQELVSKLSLNFRNKQVFIGMKEHFLNKTLELDSELDQVREDLELFEKTFSKQKVKDMEESIYQTYDSIGNIKKKMEYLTLSNFPTQRPQLLALLQDFSAQLERHYYQSERLSKAFLVSRTMQALLKTKKNIEKLISQVKETNTSIWKQPLPAFELFQKHLIEDLESNLKMLGAAAEELEKIKKKAA